MAGPDRPSPSLAAVEKYLQSRGIRFVDESCIIGLPPPN
jgi:hypothetical protein